MSQKIICKNLEETKILAGKLLEKIQKNKVNVILLQGDLGAGKTAFCQEILRLSGAEGPFTSPTFVIIRKYVLESDQNFFQAIYHLDCYRIGEKDLLDLGWKEIIVDKKNLVLVEWPERIRKIWPRQYLKIDFQVWGEKERKIQWHFVTSETEK